MRKRKHSKVSDWLLIIEAWKKSGLTKKQFCQQNNVSYKTFYRWHRQLQGPDLNTPVLNKPTTPSLTDFIPVTVREISQQVPKPEQHYILLFNDKLQLQIPTAMMNTNLLQMLMAASGAHAC